MTSCAKKDERYGFQTRSRTCGCNGHLHLASGERLESASTVNGRSAHAEVDAPGRDAADGVVTTLLPGQVLSRLRIGQMDCPTEEGLIRTKLKHMVGVHALEFNLMQRILTVVHAGDVLEEVVRAIASLGMRAEVLTASDDSSAVSVKPEPDQVFRWKPLAAVGIFALLAEVLHFIDGPSAVIALSALAAIALCGLGTYRKGWIAVRHGNLNINALMSIAVTGAMLIGEWPEAAMVMVLFNLAELIEARSLDSARHAIRGLLDLAPQRALVLQHDGEWREQSCELLRVGDLVRVRPGERIGADGVIVAGGSAVDQSPITGESLPIDKGENDPVFAATVNTSGTFDYRVSAAAGQTLLARIIKAVESAQGARAPTQRFIDRFSRVYTPAVVLLAALAAVLPPLLMQQPWSDAIYTALTLLIIACPCALVISTPVSIVSGLTAASRHGILVKGGAYLEAGRDLSWLALDKTGTITHGKPQRTDQQVWQTSRLTGLPADGLAASLAVRSDHPVSIALAQAAENDRTPLFPVDTFEALPGLGVSGVIDGVRLYLGNVRLVENLGGDVSGLKIRIEALEQQGKTVVLLTDAEQVLWLSAAADTVKAESAEAIADLHALGIRTMLLSGDNRHTVAAIAAQVGIDEAYGELLPEDKQTHLQSKHRDGELVGMVGDGINDAPALASADIGFAMGAIGSGAAIETADVTLMDDDLRKLGMFVRLSRRTHRILIQNIAFALAGKAVFLVLALSGHASLWMAVFADVGISLLVVANGLRLLRTKAGWR